MISETPELLNEYEIIGRRNPASLAPVIGIEIDWTERVNEDESVSLYYYKSKVDEIVGMIARLGGEPFFISFNDDVNEVVKQIDGLLICGGRDINPSFYGQEVSGTKVPPTDTRFKWVKRIFESLPKSIPIFGVCWGMQFLNVMHGGSLVQHMENAESHKNSPNEIEFTPGSWFHQMVGKNSVIMCRHHQIIDKVGAGFEVVGWDTISKTPHAFEFRDNERWIKAVQCHPEIIFSDNSLVEFNQKLFAIFEGFVNVCETKKKACHSKSPVILN